MPKHSMFFKKTLHLFFLMGFALTLHAAASVVLPDIFAQTTFAAPRTWDGGGVTNNWSEDANWTTSKPVDGDSVTFSSGAKDAIMDIPLSLTTLTINSTYTGIVTQAEDLTLTTSFVHSVSGGTFTWSSGTLTFSGGTAATWNVDTGDDTFGNVIINKSTGVNVTVTSGDTVTVTGDLTLTNGKIATGTVDVDGDIITTGGEFDGGTGTITVTGSARTLSTLVGGTILPGVTLNGAGIVMNGPTTGTVTFAKMLTITDGTYTGGAGNTELAGTTTGGLTIGPDTGLVTPLFTAPSGLLKIEGALSVTDAATFDHNSSMVYADCGILTISGTFTLNDFIADCQSQSETITLESGATVTVEGLFQLFGNEDQMTLESSSPGVEAELALSGTSYFSDVIVQDINVSTGSLYCLVGCTNAGNNTNIRFGQPGYLITDYLVPTTEAGGTATFDMSLLGEPTADVTISVSSSDLTEATVLPATLTFTAANYATPQTVTVTGEDDVLDDGGITYTIILTADSVDTLYDAKDPTDLSLVNADDDEDTGASGFDTPSAYTMEDVKDTSTPAVAWLTAGNGLSADAGYVNLLDGEGGSPVDLDAAGSKIQPGCTVVLAGGQKYIIRSLKDDPLSDYNALITDPNYDATSFTNVLDTDLAPDMGDAVSAIYCTEMTGDAFQLPQNPVVTQIGSTEIPSLGQNMLYDSVNNTIWANNNSNDELYRIDAATGTLLSTIATGAQSTSSDGRYIALDTASNAIWVTNRTDATVSKINAATGAYFNGDLPSSTFATISGSPSAITFDDTNDDIWLGFEAPSGAEIQRMETDGSSISSITLSGLDRVYGLIYEPTDDALWVGGHLMDPDYNITTRPSLMKLNATTGLFYNGTRANSTVIIPHVTFHDFVYDSVRDVIWAVDIGGWNSGVLVEVDAATLELLNAYPLGGLGSSSILFDATRDVLLISDDTSSIVNEVDPDTGIVLNEYSVGGFPTSIALDAQGDLWSMETGAPSTYTEYVTENIINGVPYDQYYSLTTTDTSQVDVSAEDAISSLTLTDNDDGEDLFYAISFDDRETFSVFTGGAWRAIASSLDTVHGGVDGTWYYRDNADAWTAASISTPTRALSEAVAEGANNQMVTATLTGLSEANWEAVGGFDADTTLTVDMGVALRTTDPRDPPMVDEVLFAFGGSPSFTVTESLGTTAVTEGGATDSFTVVLDMQPTTDVVFDIASNDTSSATVSAAQLTFTNGNWDTPQTITVTAPQDDDAVSETPTITISINDAGSDNAWDALANQTVDVTVTDNDTAGITVSAISGDTTEAGGTATFTVVLDTQPAGDVVITAATADATEGTVSSGSTLTFTTLNWDDAQTVTVTGVDDALDDGNIAYTITVSVDAGSTDDAVYDLINPDDVAVTNVDNDEAAGGSGSSGGSGIFNDSSDNNNDSGADNGGYPEACGIRRDNVPFIDIADSWAKEEIETLYKMGVVDGRAPTLFIPSDELTRAEMVKIAMLLFCYPVSPSQTQTSFSDVPQSAWYAQYISVAEKEGIVTGYKDGTFRPDENISRAEALKILLEASRFSLETTGTHPFEDVPTGAWYEDYLTYAYTNEILSGKTRTSFAPNDDILRSEITRMALNAYHLGE